MSSMQVIRREKEGGPGVQGLPRLPLQVYRVLLVSVVAVTLVVVVFFSCKVCTSYCPQIDG